jgi:methylenetetrahydrofolate reductase (NADPH)
VPHITARGFSRPAELNTLLAALRDEAAVNRILLIGGDIAVARGAFESSLDVLATGALEQHGIQVVGLAGYPEGHHTLGPAKLWENLMAKLAQARARGLSTEIVTQFCFEARPLATWFGELQRRGIDVPVRIGMAGPASISSLITFAMRCGIGNSLRAITNRPESIGRLLRDATPDDLLAGLAEAWAGQLPERIPLLHVFPFGGVAKSGAWLQRARNRLPQERS